MIRTQFARVARVAMLGLMLPAVGWSQADTPIVADAGSGSMLAVLLPVMAVLGTLLAALVFVNRKRGLFNTDGPLRIVQVLSVGPRERVMVLSAGNDTLVIGVTTGQITLLSVLDPSVVADEVVQTS